MSGAGSMFTGIPSVNSVVELQIYLNVNRAVVLSPKIQKEPLTSHAISRNPFYEKKKMS